MMMPFESLTPWLEVDRLTNDLVAADKQIRELRRENANLKECHESLLRECNELLDNLKSIAAAGTLRISMVKASAANTGEILRDRLNTGKS